ncbi:hypothetical protein BJV82DRAFT_384597 [Fennellomyces sp. T-0311]|nr:hypothetical protein BJV82DRAFT_384597 [Fennellomyces sp. T-0311]
MLTRFQVPSDDNPPTSDPAAPIACTQCKKRKVHCDRVKPTCGECTNNTLLCRYTLSLLSEPMRDPLREIETRLKKMETQLRPKSSDKSTGMAGSTPSTSRRRPNFRLAEGDGGLCVETEITEAHHFIKLLFNTIDVTKIRYLAQGVFEAHLRSSAGVAELPTEPPDVLLNQLLARNNAVEQTWLDMVVSSQHHRCFIIRAYVFHHEDELHQDTEYPVRTGMGPVYFQCAQVLLEDCYTVSHRTTIRALLHLFLYHFHGKTEEAFPYCDLALRMALDLGLHERRSTHDPTQTEDDRRLWWAAYWCRLYTVVEYHRPITMQDDEIKVTMPQRLPEENLDIGYCIDYCTMSIKLLRIRRSIAGALKSADSTHALLYQIQDLEEALEQWHEQLPSHADLTQTWEDPLCTELGILLHAQYHSVRLQMYQCFLDNAAPLSLLAVLNCERAAAKVIDMLVQHGASMRMCACIRLVPTLHRCVAVLTCNAEFKDSSAIAIDAIERLRQLNIVLRTHSFKYLNETAAVTRLIDSILRTHPPKSTTKPPKPIAPAITTPPDQKPPAIVNNAACPLPSEDTPIVKQQPLEITPSPTQQQQYVAPITPTPQQLSDAYTAGPIPPPPGGLSAAASAYTTQIQEASASFGSLDQVSLGQAQMMNTYGQPIVPAPSTSFTITSAYTASVTGSGIPQFTGASSTDDAWTASFPVNPQALSMLSMLRTHQFQISLYNQLQRRIHH